jgi:hypothetical protein
MKNLLIAILLVLALAGQAGADSAEIYGRELQSGEIIAPATVTLTAQQINGRARSAIVNNYGQSNDAVITLPVIAKDMFFDCILGTTVAKYYRITAGASDKIYLDGVAGADGGYVGIASAVAGAALSCRAFQTGAAAYDWYCSTASGNWVAGP